MDFIIYRDTREGTTKWFDFGNINKFVQDKKLAYGDYASQYFICDRKHSIGELRQSLTARLARFTDIVKGMKDNYPRAAIILEFKEEELMKKCKYTKLSGADLFDIYHNFKLARDIEFIFSTGRVDAQLKAIKLLRGET